VALDTSPAMLLPALTVHWYRAFDFFLALFSLIRAVRDWPLAGLWTVLLLIAGNLGIILLEGIVVVIQAMRLEYYEFFSKFFPAGKGVEYHPLTPND